MFEADAIAALRSARRTLSRWRTAAFIAIAVAVVALAVAGGIASGTLSKYSDHIARVEISGLITGDEKTLELLEKISKEKHVKALIVHIDSPGGTTAGSEAIYEALRAVAGKKPVVSTMGTVAASGGYITAIATDHIVARGNTITGSIGVIFQWAQVQELLKSFGVKMETIKSGELKAEPNLFKEPSPKVREVTRQMVLDSFDWFVSLVAERRKLTKARALELADGRVYTGRQALKVKLIDEIGGRRQAKAWLVAERKISSKLKIVDWKVEDDSLTGVFSTALGRAAAAAFGLNADIIKRHADKLKLDGLMSVWQAGR